MAWYLTERSSGLLTILASVIAGSGGFLLGAGLGRSRRLARQSESKRAREIEVKQLSFMIQTQKTGLETTLFRLPEEEIRNIASRILEHFSDFSLALREGKRGPGELAAFLEVFGSWPCKVLEAYLRVRSIPAKDQSPGEQEILDRAKRLISRLEAAFEARNGKNHRMDLDVIEEEILALGEGLGLRKDPPDQAWNQL